MKIAYCKTCSPVLIVGVGHFKGTPTHSVKGKAHTSSVVVVEDEDREPSENTSDFLKRLLKKHKSKLK